jgi:HAD superfamily hydrolase (TIGR01458 family)
MKTIKGIIFDVDGVLVYQGDVCPGAIETVAALRKNGIVLRFLTNSTLNSRQSYAEKLNHAGFQIYCQEVITASYATAVYLSHINPTSCWIMLERAGLDEFKGFQQDRDNPEYIVIGDNRSCFDFHNLNEVLRRLMQGSKLIGMIPELVDTSLGEIELNVGSWVSMLERASGVKATYIGKPGPCMFELTLETMNLDRSAVAMVGDRVSTDVKGARNYGITSVLLRTGEFDEKDLEGDVKPDFAFDTIQEVLTIV